MDVPERLNHLMCLKVRDMEEDIGKCPNYLNHSLLIKNCSSLTSFCKTQLTTHHRVFPPAPNSPLVGLYYYVLRLHLHFVIWHYLFNFWIQIDCWSWWHYENWKKFGITLHFQEKIFHSAGKSGNKNAVSLPKNRGWISIEVRPKQEVLIWKMLNNNYL